MVQSKAELVETEFGETELPETILGETVPGKMGLVKEALSET